MCNFEISDAIATIALLISIVTLCFQFLPNRKNIKCKKVYFWNTDIYPNEKYYFCVTHLLENHSSLPITITDIKLIIDNEEFSIHSERIPLFGGSIETLSGIEAIEVFSNTMPITLNPLSAQTIRALFFIKKYITPKSIMLKFETTRGTIKIKNIDVISKQH